MTAEEQAAAEAAAAASQQTPEEIAAAEAAKQPYTDEELSGFTPTSEIDLDRVPAPIRPVIENMTRDYKELQKGYSQKAQEAADLKRAKDAEPETYFEDSKKDGVFKDYLKSPLKIIGEINAEIANLESVIPDDGADEYRKARRQIAYWNGLKDEFSARRIEVSEQRRQRETSEGALKADLGDDAQAILDYAETVGVGEKELRANPKLRTAIKTMYAVANAGKTALKKEVKPNPQKTATPSGGSGGGEHSSDDDAYFDPKLSTAERIAMGKKRRAAGS